MSTLEWKEIEVFVGERASKPFSKRAKVEDKTRYRELEAPLVQEVRFADVKKAIEKTSGVLRAGEMLALMGPSGAGKTTLISVLGSRPQLGKDGCWTGQVLVNGRHPSGRWRRQIAFVMQRDIFFSTLTVRQELEFACALRGGGNDSQGRSSPEALRRRLNDVVKALGLEKVLDSKIGSSVERGLSGGETKRLNIAIELFISDASICLLDEPLTGLDSSRAYSVLSALRDKAICGTYGILLSIHQPTSSIWALFDRLLLLAPRGRVVYDGKASEAASYFAGIGKPVPQEWNPPDHFIELISLNDENDLQREASKATVELLVKQWRTNQHQQKKTNDVFYDNDDETAVSETADTTFSMTEENHHHQEQKKQAKPPSMATFRQQAFALTKRNFSNAKGTVLKPTRWFSVLSLAVIWGILYWSISRGGNAKRGKNSADMISIVYFFVSQWAWGPSFQTVGAFPAERDVLTKELASELYSIEAYFLSKQIAEIPLSTVLPFAFYVVIFPMVGLPWIAFPATYAISILHSWVSTSLGVALSALIFDAEQTATVLIVVNIFQSSAGGFFIDFSQQPSWISWVKYASYWFYAQGAYLKIVALPFDDKVNDIHQETKTFSFSPFSIGVDVAVLCAYGLALRLIAYLALKYSPKIRFA